MEVSATEPVVLKQLARRTDAMFASIGTDIRRLREDAGISQRRLAIAAGSDQSFLARIEAGTAHPSVETLTAISLALGADLGIRLYPNTGPSIRDARQGVMVEALLRVTHRRWRRFVEVHVQRPSRGVIDVVLQEPTKTAVVALEAQSQMRRLEQQLRWGHAKAEALRSADVARLLWPDGGAMDVSSALLLRSTRANRDLAIQFEETLRAAFPASTAAAVGALRTADEPWPGSVLLWADTDDGIGRILERPPRGVRVGR